MALRAATVALLLVTVAGYAGRLYWIFDLTSHFRLPLLCSAGAIVVGLAVLRSWKWAALAGLAVVLNGASIHAGIPRSAPGHYASGDPTLSVFYANVLSSNEAVPLLASQIRRADPDVILLVEVNDHWLYDLGEVTDDYPHRIEAPRTDNFGIAAYSRVPLAAGTTFPLSADSLGLAVPAVQMIVEAPQGPVQLLGIHTVPPISARASAGRNEQLDQVAGLVRAATVPTAVVGDLNITPYSPQYSRFIEGSRTDARPTGLTSGLGVADHPLRMGTWMAGLPALVRLPIDHCLAGAGVEVLAMHTGDPFGSDHRPLICQFALPREPGATPKTP